VGRRGERDVRECGLDDGMAWLWGVLGEREKRRKREKGGLFLFFFS